MPDVTIDNRHVSVPDGSTVLDAASALGIEIPTLCHYPGCAPQNSCLVCVVSINGSDRLEPSCSTRVVEGMTVQNDCDTVRAARRTALELLLSDHAGDCIAPCQNTCPAHMDIPLMLRQIGEGDLAEALITVKRDIPLPAVLGRICPAPCESGCRRSASDDPVSVCMLKRYVADQDLATGSPFVPPRQPDSGKRVAIIGAGPTGLSAAYYLQQSGHQCVVFDDQDQPGGMLRYGVPEEAPERDVLDGEIDIVRQLGAEFRMNTRIGHDLTLQQLRDDYDAVLLAVGHIDDQLGGALGVTMSDHGIAAERATFRTDLPGVFAAGGSVRQTRLAVRSVADGKDAAVQIDRHLAGNTGLVVLDTYNSLMGRLREDELADYMLGAPELERITPAGGLKRGYGPDEALTEAQRCLQCDCSAACDCRIRQYATQYEADRNRFRGTRRRFERRVRASDVIYEPGKCIACGLCVEITRQAGEPLGVTFVGRGFDVRIATPNDQSISDGLGRVAAECIDACPTGSLVFAGGTSASCGSHPPPTE
ncbi:MAG: glutamate synthase [Planctomycetaceae bacterium]|nr:glutamate synthase [Planctomycetaceae bacterium]